jgi:hypothetical protein
LTGADNRRFFTPYGEVVPSLAGDWRCAMTTRHLIAYLLILLLAVGIGWAVWSATYNSKRRVRRRQRRERQARHRARELEERPE